LHVVIVHHIRQVIGGEPIGFQQHQILECDVLENHLAPDQVVDDGFALSRHGEADDERRSGRQIGVDLILAERAASTIVPRRFFLGLLLFAKRLKTFRCAETTIGGAAFDKVHSRLLIELGPLALDVGRVWSPDIRSLVPMDSEPVENIQNALGRPFDKAAPVCVLDPEDQRTIFALSRCLPIGDEPVEEGGSGASDVQQSSGRGRKPHPNGWRWVCLVEGVCHVIPAGFGSSIVQPVSIPTGIGRSRVKLSQYHRQRHGRPCVDGTNLHAHTFS